MGKRDDVTVGLVIAAGIVMQSHSEDVIAEEILRAAGITTSRQARAIGVDQYDIDILKPVFRQIVQSKKYSAGRPRPASYGGVRP